MLDAADVDRMFPLATGLAIALWLILHVVAYSATPSDQWVVLPKGSLEREAPLWAAIVLTTSLIYFCFPFAGGVLRAGQRRQDVSGVFSSAVVILTLAIITNLTLAFCPTIVMLDPVLGSKVYIARWCEWVPLAALMTFMSDIVDVEATPKKKGIEGPTGGGIRESIIHSLSQLVSTFGGYIFPFCPNLQTWFFFQVLAFSTYVPIFWRTNSKYNRLLACKADANILSHKDKEDYERRYFAYHLMRLCAIVWTVLVVVYYCYALLCLNFLSNPSVQNILHPSTAMVVDTVFDVMAKCLYTKVIVEVHYNVFDSNARSGRQLQELRRLMQVLWDSTTDAIIISVQDQQQASTFLSPSFQALVGGPALLDDSSEQDEGVTPGLMLRTSSKKNQVLDAKYIDSCHISSSDSLENLASAPAELKSGKVALAAELVGSCWKQLKDNMDSEASLLMVHEFVRPDGEKCCCELKVCRKTPDSFVAIVRDVTERYKRLDAEQRAHAEAISRQKDAQNVNRFTRHEVKNGLLSSIELCETIQDIMRKAAKKADGDNEAENARSVAERTVSKISGVVGQLDTILHEVLDTVLAEAMARDVIHETYQPQPKSTNILDALKSTNGGGGNAECSRFPLIMRPSEGIPDIMLDPQLLRYIHRNAVSNANKYGRRGGIVSTIASYNLADEQLTIEVVNEAGPDHDRLLAMGEEATRAVFESGTRLHTNDFDRGSLSSGDGAWIMQKCAKNMKGSCSISFGKEETVFRFTCQAPPVVGTEKPHIKFTLPAGTWGVGIDDSWIQRKLLLRIFTNAGVDSKRRKVLGRVPEELEAVAPLLLSVLVGDPQCYILVLVDENLDFQNESGAGRVIRSGSKMMQQVMQYMPPAYLERILVLVRSANDSADDIATYESRTHGFFSKTATRKEAILEVLHSAWKKRFGGIPERPVLDISNLGNEVLEGAAGDNMSTASRSSMDETETTLSGDDVREVVSAVDTLLRGKHYTDIPWPRLWSALHSLKGDIMVSEKEQLKLATAQISAMRGPAPPEDFPERWEAIRRCILEAIES